MSHLGCLPVWPVWTPPQKWESDAVGSGLSGLLMHLEFSSQHQGWRTSSRLQHLKDHHINEWNLNVNDRNSHILSSSGLQPCFSKHLCSACFPAIPGLHAPESWDQINLVNLNLKSSCNVSISWDIRERHLQVHTLAPKQGHKNTHLYPAPVSLCDSGHCGHLIFHCTT